MILLQNALYPIRGIYFRQMMKKKLVETALALSSSNTKDFTEYPKLCGSNWYKVSMHFCIKCTCTYVYNVYGRNHTSVIFSLPRTLDSFRSRWIVLYVIRIQNPFHGNKRNLSIYIHFRDDNFKCAINVNAFTNPCTCTEVH